MEQTNINLTDKQSRIKKRNERIRKKFQFYTDTKHYNIEHALSLLEDDFIPLQRETIWLIVSNTGYYKGK